MDLIDLVYPELTLSLMNPATLTIATVTTLMSLYLYFVQPSMLLKAYFRVVVRWSGMKLKCSPRLEDGFQFFYAEKGHRVEGQMSLLFLHGFSADHFMWAPIIQNISSNIHMIAIDLPGHGFTMDPLEGDCIGFRGQVRRIKQFVDLLGFSNGELHVVGISMGGTLAGLFAAEYPHLVGAMTITCPCMKTPVESRVIELNKENVLKCGQLTLDNCPLLPQTAHDVQKMLNLCHFFTTKYPVQILKGVADLRRRKNDLYLRLVNELMGECSLAALENHLSKITCPTQVVWGKEDWIVHASGAEVLKAKLPNCQRVDMLMECGHAVNLDQPVTFSTVVMDFWRAQQSQRSKMKSL